MGASVAGWAQHCGAYGGQAQKGARPSPPRQAPSRRSPGPCPRKHLGTALSKGSREEDQRDSGFRGKPREGSSGVTLWPSQPSQGLRRGHRPSVAQGFVRGKECWALPRARRPDGVPWAWAPSTGWASSVPTQLLQVRAETRPNTGPHTGRLAQSWLGIP